MRLNLTTCAKHDGPSLDLSVAGHLVVGVLVRDRLIHSDLANSSMHS